MGQLLIKEAKQSIDRARAYLDQHHAQRSWAEIIRDLKVTLEKCVAILETK